MIWISLLLFCYIDGAALFGSMIQYFQNLGSNSPKVLASTHFHGIFFFFSLQWYLFVILTGLFCFKLYLEILEQRLIEVGMGLKLCHMEIFIDEESEKKGISYLYKAKPGKASSSFGIW